MKKIKVITGISIAAAVMLMVGSTSAFAQKTTKLTDPEIASAAVVANKSDIDFAMIAKQKSKNAEVLKFAATMAKDHQGIIDQAVALVTKLKVTPKDNVVSRKLTADAAKTKVLIRHILIMK
jgi:putative membrane protein